MKLKDFQSMLLAGRAAACSEPSNWRVKRNSQTSLETAMTRLTTNGPDVQIKFPYILTEAVKRAR